MTLYNKILQSKLCGNKMGSYMMMNNIALPPIVHFFKSKAFLLKTTLSQQEMCRCKEEDEIDKEESKGSNLNRTSSSVQTIIFSSTFNIYNNLI